MLILITRYNLNPKWAQILILLVFYFIFIKLHYFDNNIVDCMMRIPAPTPDRINELTNTIISDFDRINNIIKPEEVEGLIRREPLIGEAEKKTMADLIRKAKDVIININGDYTQLYANSTHLEQANQNLTQINTGLIQTNGNLVNTNQTLANNIENVVNTQPTRADLSTAISQRNGFTQRGCCTTENATFCGTLIVVVITGLIGGGVLG